MQKDVCARCYIFHTSVRRYYIRRNVKYADIAHYILLYTAYRVFYICFDSKHMD